MEQTERDGAAVRFAPPFVYLIAILLGALLHAFVLPLPLPLSGSTRTVVALFASLLGLAIGGSAFGLFRRTGQDPTPWTSTPEIIASGIYRFTRNPMYVGMALLQAGIGVALGNGWILLFVPPALAAVYRIAVRHEEAYLERKFGQTYLTYKASVRRWL